MPAQSSELARVPLCVDLSGALLRNSLQLELTFALLRQNILYLFRLPLWLLRGRTWLARQISARALLDPALLPYSRALLDYLQCQREQGRELILLATETAAAAHVQAIANHLQLFRRVIVTDSRHPGSGAQKLAALCAALGHSDFDYAGDYSGQPTAALPLWRRGPLPVLVNGEPVAAPREQGCAVEFIEDPRYPAHILWARALRLHQWLKNLLLLVPLVMAHQLDDLALLGQACIAFLAMGLCASSVYLLNDLLDLPDDRRNPLKRDRPLAAGTLPIRHGLLAIPALLAASIGLANLLPTPFGLCLALYYGLALLYSPVLKRIALVDVLVLAVLYTLRIVAGAAAVSVAPSPWLLAFSLFVFFSLALLKRYAELRSLLASGLDVPAGRGYRASDLDTLSRCGGISACLAILVLALYTTSDTAAALYARPALLWLLCPLLLYMLSRLWLLARRGELQGDPVVFVITDRPGQWLALIGALLFWLAI